MLFSTKKFCFVLALFLCAGSGLVPAHASPTLSQPSSASRAIQLAQGQCRHLMGPYNNQSTAYYYLQQARYAGYQTSDVWGQGGVVSNWSNRQYFFYVYYPC